MSDNVNVAEQVPAELWMNIFELMKFGFWECRYTRHRLDGKAGFDDDGRHGGKRECLHREPWSMSLSPYPKKKFSRIYALRVVTKYQLAGDHAPQIRVRESP